MCITEDSRRVEDTEIELVNMLSNNMPVIDVIIKSRADHDFQATVKQLLPNACNVIRVRAIEETLDEGMTLPKMGLDKLIELTEEVILKGRRNALAAAQKAFIKQKVDRAQAVITASTTTAIAISVSSILFSDAALLIPIEIGMLAGISKVFGLDLAKGLLGTPVSSMLGTSVATIG